MPPLSPAQLSVVVPVYRSVLDPNEAISLDSIFRVLGAHRLVMVKPAGLDTGELERRYPWKGIETFDPGYFTSIQGYNRLLLSTEFYARFLASRFMLVCQLDVFVFRDELTRWVEADYDYVGAPWISGSAASLMVHRLTQVLGRLRPGRPERISSYQLRNRVGNGGFSLRKVELHHRLSLVLKETIDHYLRHAGTHHFHEDVFWSVEPARRGLPHRTPGVEEAMAFAWDINPERLYAMAGGQLPMAAHGWYKGRHRAFWGPRVAAARG